MNSYPDLLNCCVRIFLKNGDQAHGYWDGTSWWEELEYSTDTRLIEEDTIERWEWIT
jgi:hypothetical protein